ncbi:MAG: motility associated factor glycosyltransferase family protein [Brevinematales bacterium]
MQIEKINGKFPNLRIKMGEKVVSLHSFYPLKEAERVVKHFNPSFSTVVIAGIGLGYVIEYILQSTSYTLVIYEHDDTFASWNSEFIEKIKQNPRVKIFQKDPQALIDYLAEHGIGEFNLYIHRPYAILFPAIYDSLHGLLVAYLSRRQINQATARRFQKLWVRNILKNSLFYSSLPGIQHLSGSGKGYPALVIGAGPSLVKNAHLLSEAKKRHWILIATDTVLAYLDRLGVEADFVVSVDPQDKNALYLLSSRQKPYLILDSGASFLTFIHYPHERIFLYDTVLPLYQVFRHFWGEKGELLCGGSVSTTAYDFAYRLGCEPIVFVGQDLAYSDHQTHAPHNALESMLYSTVDRFHTYEGYNATSQTFSDRIEVKAWNGHGTVLTDRKFLTFKEWFGKITRERSIRTINATEGGLFIEGMEHIPLCQVIESVVSPNQSYHLPPTTPYAHFEQNFLSILKELRQTLEILKVALARDNPEEKLFSLVKQNPLFGRLIEMTMQESIQKLLSSQSVDETLLSQLRREIREGSEFLSFLIEKRLLLEESLHS